MLYLFLGIVLMCSQVWAQPTDVELKHAYGVQAATCVPGPSAVPYLSFQKDYVGFAAGKWSAHSTPHLRCQIAVRGKATWSELNVIYKDPDGKATDARVLVTVWNSFKARPPGIMAQFDSNDFSGHYLWQTNSVAIPQTGFLFTTHIYWIDIALTRRTATTISPVVQAVWLKYSGYYDPYTGR